MIINMLVVIFAALIPPLHINVPSLWGNVVPIVQYSHSDAILVAKMIYAESRGEPELGKIAVACVVKNRVEFDKSSYHFELIERPNQFAVSNHYSEQGLRIAQNVLSNIIPCKFLKGAMYFYNPSTSNPYWAKRKDFEFVVQIGAHKFYKRNF